MIYINLLPWRETRLRRKRRNFLAQTMSLLSLTIISSGFLFAKNTSQIESQRANLEKIKAENHSVFSQIEDFQSAQGVFLKQQQDAERINKLISERQTIPQLLALLQNRELLFQVSYLLVNHKNIKIIGADISSGSALLLLNTLREESVFCQVTFTPLQTKSAALTVEFELRVEICNENTD